MSRMRGKQSRYQRTPSVTTHVSGQKYSIYISMIFMSETMSCFIFFLYSIWYLISFTLFLHTLFVIIRYASNMKCVSRKHTDSCFSVPPTINFHHFSKEMRVTSNPVVITSKCSVTITYFINQLLDDIISSYQTIKSIRSSFSMSQSNLSLCIICKESLFVGCLC